MLGRIPVGLDLAQQLRTAHQSDFDGNSFRRESGYVPDLKRGGIPRGKKENVHVKVTDLWSSRSRGADSGA